MDTETSPFMNATQTAVYLKIHKMSLYRLAKKGKIPHLRLGKDGKILFHKPTIDLFLQSSSLGGT